MGRIIFLCPFSKSEITGGIKTIYRHAELLGELGFDACVYQPDGHPPWFESRATVISVMIAPMANDVLVFPEGLNGKLAEMAGSRMAAKKVLFCQAQFYTLFNAVPPERYTDLGFHGIACQSQIAKGFLERALHLRDVSVIPCFIDPDLFFPRKKSMQIAFMPHKLPREAAVLRSLFTLKYPDLASVRWIPIEKKSEREVAEIFGSSAVVLSLPFLESFGLVPLEAMASGAIVVGFDGYGGREYATAKNGFWFAPDHLEETVDALARVVTGLGRDEPEFHWIREAGAATAARYNKDRTRMALREFYDSLP